LAALLLLAGWLAPGQGAAAPEAKDGAGPRIAGLVEGKPVYADDLLDREIHEARGKVYELELAKLREVALKRLRESRPGEFPVPPLTVSDQEVEALYEEANLSKRGTLKELTPQIREYIQAQKRGELDKKHYELALAKGYVKPLLLAPAAFEVELANVKRPAAKGPADAPVQIVEFSDFQCPFCNRARPAVEQVIKTYGEEVRLVYRHLPLVRIHARAQELAEASECAAEQGKFWPFHDAVFDRFGELETLDADTIAREAGVRDAGRFRACRESGKFRARVAEDTQAAESLGIGGTPTFLIGRLTADGAIRGVLLEGAQPFSAFEREIERVLEKAAR
jgi:protein-disulfide isomerase